MTAYIWRIAADTPNYQSVDLSGAGAKITGGRWNRVGGAMVYTATSIALAALETVVHINATLPLNRYLVRIDVPDQLWNACPQLTPSVGWDALPPGQVSLDHGDQWLAANTSALLKVPSVVVPEEFCVLVNPAHPDAAQLTATKIRKWTYDSRIKSP